MEIQHFKLKLINIQFFIYLDVDITLNIGNKLATLQNITLPRNNDIELEVFISLPDDCESLNDFLKCFDFSLS